MTFKRVMAFTAVIIIAGMYVASLVLALIGSEKTVPFFLLSILCTIMIPLMLHLYMMLRNAKHGKNIMDETYSYREKKE